MADIEEMEESLIDHNVRLNLLSTRELIDLRKVNLKITKMMWITKRIVIDEFYTVYNPKTVVLVWLN